MKNKKIHICHVMYFYLLSVDRELYHLEMHHMRIVIFLLYLLYIYIYIYIDIYIDE